MGVKLGKLSVPNVLSLIEFPEFEITAELVSDNWNDAYDMAFIETPWTVKTGDKIVSMDAAPGNVTVPVDVGFIVAPPASIIPPFSPDAIIQAGAVGSPSGPYTQIWNRTFGSDGSTVKILVDGMVIYLVGTTSGSEEWPSGESRLIRISAFR